MKLQTILNRLQKLHPKEIDLSLDRVKNLCKKLGDPQKKLKYISVVGTNGKYSTVQAVRSILKNANIDCNIYDTSCFNFNAHRPTKVFINLSWS